MLKIAFDVGGVLFEDVTFELSAEAVMSLRLVIEKFNRENVYIISKAGPKYQRIIMERLISCSFFEATSLKPEHVHFVLEYVEKKWKCEELGINYMVDDHIKVVRYVSTCTDCTPIWFGAGPVNSMKTLQEEHAAASSTSTSNRHTER